MSWLMPAWRSTMSEATDIYVCGHTYKQTYKCFHVQCLRSLFGRSRGVLCTLLAFLLNKWAKWTSKDILIILFEQKKRLTFRPFAEQILMDLYINETVVLVFISFCFILLYFSVKFSWNPHLILNRWNYLEYVFYKPFKVLYISRWKLLWNVENLG